MPLFRQSTLLHKHSTWPVHRMSDNRNMLLSSAKAFCDAFATEKPLDEILEYFSTEEEPVAIEHGLQQLTPFTGRSFRGIGGIKDYFGIISGLLSYEGMRFSDYFVDTVESKVSVRGQATFTWKETSNRWPEIFTYVLHFDAKQKVKKYEVWADTGAAYLACKGELQRE